MLVLMMNKLNAILENVKLAIVYTIIDIEHVYKYI